MAVVYETLKLSNTWAASELDIGLGVLLKKSKRLNVDSKFSIPPLIEGEIDLEKLATWFEINAEASGFFVQTHKWKGKITRDILSAIGTGVVRIKIDGVFRFLLVAESNSKYLTIMSRGKSFGRVSVEYVAQKLISAVLASSDYKPPNIVFDQSLSANVKNFAAKIALKNFIDNEEINGVWAIELSPSISLLKQLSAANFPRLLVLLVGLASLNYIIYIFAWKTFSEFIFGHVVDKAGILSWSLLLLTAVPINILFSYKFGEMGIKFSLIFKKLFLNRLLNVPKGEVKKKGAGLYLGAIAEAENIETSIFQGANSVFLGIIQAFVLVASTLFHETLWYFGLAIVVWLFAIFAVNFRFYQLSLGWSLKKLDLTGTFFERIQGLLTERIQRSEEDLVKETDLSLATFYGISRRFDGIQILGSMLPNSAWMVLSCVLMIPLVVLENSNSMTMALAVGIVVLSTACFSQISVGVMSLIRAFVAYKQVNYLIGSANKVVESSSNSYIEQQAKEGLKESGEDLPILSMKDLDFRYKNQNRLVLEHCKLDIYKSDRIIISGKSGGGKSTLAKILNLENEPLHGSLLLYGLDRSAWHTLQWRQKIVYVPQFHSNYVFTASFAYNALMAGQWPAPKEKFERLYAICMDLGLENVVKSMPDGIWQMLGESGWQLSHGEKSRLYIARGILQNPDVLILDESLAAVDPDTGDQVLSAIDKYVKTCVMIAHA